MDHGGSSFVFPSVRKRRVPTLDLRLIDLSASQRTMDDPPNPILSGHGTPSTSANPPNDLQYPTWPAIRPRRAWTTLSTFHYHCWCRWVGLSSSSELGRLLWARFWSDLPSLLRETIADGMTLPPSIRCFLPTPLDSSSRRSDIVPGKRT